MGEVRGGETKKGCKKNLGKKGRQATHALVFLTEVRRKALKRMDRNKGGKKGAISQVHNKRGEGDYWGRRGTRK